MINGQKIYTSLASYADYIWLAARTDPDAPKHKGITIFLVPTTDPGFSYTKIHTMVNASTTSTYLRRRAGADDAVIVGELNRGWDLITNQLNYERVSLSPPGMVERCYDDVVEWAQDTKLPDGRRVIDQEWVQVNLASGPSEDRVPEAHQLEGVAPGRSIPASASSTKVFGTEFFTEAYRLLLEVVGPAASSARVSPTRRWRDGSSAPCRGR